MNLTVIVPVYNGEETIAGCLAALVSQEGLILGKDYEVLVVDDGSTDRTREIASKFPVRVITLKANKGRIIARLAGAREASSENLLFVDSRVLLDRHAIKNIIRLRYSPLIAGDYKERENKYKSIFHTVFYLIRRRVYGKTLFPQKEDELWITKENFNYAPKGTTVLYITKSLFLKAIPDRTGKDVSDDTLLFHNMVFGEGVRLLRHRLVKAEYLQRTKIRDLVKWLYWRGIRFSDYHLRPGRRFFVPFILTTLISMASAALIFMFPYAITYVLFALFVFYIFCLIYLSENIRDFFTLLFVTPFVGLVFLAGTLRYWGKTFLAPYFVQNEKNCRSAHQ